jgi:hypothetical protein
LYPPGLNHAVCFPPGTDAGGTDEFVEADGRV